MARAKKKLVYSVIVPPSPTGPPPPVPENAIEHIEDLLIETADEALKQTIARVLNPLAAQREFCDLQEEVSDMRAETRAVQDECVKRLAALPSIAASLSAKSDMKLIGDTANRFLDRLGKAIGPLMTELPDLMQDIAGAMLNGLQRRIKHFNALFKVTADVVQDRNDATQSELREMRTAILKLKKEVKDLQEAAPLWKDRAVAAESALKDSLNELRELRRPRPCPGRGRSPAQDRAEASSRCGSRGTSRAASLSLERVRLATVRKDYAEAVCQAQMVATLSVIDDTTHPLASCAAQLWSDEHGRPFDPSE
jgi:hypothetical protein